MSVSANSTPDFRIPIRGPLPFRDKVTEALTRVAAINECAELVRDNVHSISFTHWRYPRYQTYMPVSRNRARIYVCRKGRALDADGLAVEISGHASHNQSYCDCIAKGGRGAWRRPSLHERLRCRKRWVDIRRLVADYLDAENAASIRTLAMMIPGGGILHEQHPFVWHAWNQLKVVGDGELDVLVTRAPDREQIMSQWSPAGTRPITGSDVRDHVRVDGSSEFCAAIHTAIDQLRRSPSGATLEPLMMPILETGIQNSNQTAQISVHDRPLALSLESVRDSAVATAGLLANKIVYRNAGSTAANSEVFRASPLVREIESLCAQYAVLADLSAPVDTLQFLEIQVLMLTVGVPDALKQWLISGQ